MIVTITFEGRPCSNDYDYNDHNYHFVKDVLDKMNDANDRNYHV
jgi:hypothetical protein